MSDWSVEGYASSAVGSSHAPASADPPAKSQELGNGVVQVARIAGKGRGLLATRHIPRDAVILTEPVIVVRSPEEIRLIDERTVLGMYAIGWGERSICFPLGLTMLINHSRQKRLCNVTSEHDYANDVIRVRALRDIMPGEELVYDYEVADEVLVRSYGIPPDA